MTVVFGDGIPEVFESLPSSVRKQAAGVLDLLPEFPRLYPIRRRGVMKGYRYFIASEYLFYYSVASDEIRLAAIIPGRMGGA